MDARGTWLAAALLLAATPAAAQQSASQQAPGTATTGPIEIGGAQPVQCGASFDRASAVVNLVANSSQDVGVEIECNARFVLRARSSYGVFRHETAYAPGDPRTFVSYSVSWPTSLFDSNGSPIGPEFTASGSAWANGIAVNSAPTMLAQSGRMLISWQTAANVLAGNYGDTFYLDIEAD